MNSETNSEKETKQFCLGDVLKYVLHGAPFYWRNDHVPWRLVRVPRFPIAFSILAGIFASIPNFVMATHHTQKPIDKFEIVIALIVSLPIVIIIFLAFNYLIMAGFLIILGRFNKSLEQDDKLSLRAGVQRVSYFSTVFQVLLFFVYASSYVLVDYYKLTGWRAHTLMGTIVFFCIVRLLSVFQSMKYEAHWSISAGLLALISCFDVWFVFCGIILHYIVL